MKVVIVGENNKARLNKALEAALYIVGFPEILRFRGFFVCKLCCDLTGFEWVCTGLNGLTMG